MMNSYEQSPTRADVKFLFEEFLGRAPAEDDITHFAKVPTLGELHKLFRNSREARYRQLAVLSKEHLRENLDCDVEWSSSSRDIDRLIQHTRTVWERYGREEAHFSVLTNPIFKPDRLDRGTIELFYSTGQDEADLVVRLCQASGVAVNPAWTVIELGCGLGRITEHLSAKFAHVTGVDVSKPHLTAAAQRLESKARRNVTFTLLPDFLRSEMSADLFVSFLVLQHNPPPVIAFLIENCLARLNKGGIAIFQCVTKIFDYHFRVRDYLAAMDQSAGAMEMHALPQSAIMQIARKVGCSPLLVLPDGHGANIGLSYTFVMQKA